MQEERFQEETPAGELLRTSPLVAAEDVDEALPQLLVLRLDACVIRLNATNNDAQEVKVRGSCAVASVEYARGRWRGLWRQRGWYRSSCLASHAGSDSNMPCDQ